jgi:hypothetical protein
MTKLQQAFVTDAVTTASSTISSNLVNLTNKSKRFQESKF